MEKDEKIQSNEDSLKIITEMIHKTQINIKQGSFHFLFWGWLILICSLGHYVGIIFNLHPHPEMIWFLTIPGAIISLAYGFITGKKARFTTYADQIYMWTWMGYLFTMLVLVVILSPHPKMITLYVLMLTGFPTFLSGIILRFTPLVIGGILFWTGALVAFFTGLEYYLLILALTVGCGYLIPGYLLKRKVSNETI